MARFVTVESQVWRDEAFLRLGADARLLFLWAWGNDRAQPSGLYVVERRRMLTAFSWPEQYRDHKVAVASGYTRLHDALDELKVKPLMLYDNDHSLLWVVNRARYANRNMATQAAIRRGWAEAPDASHLKHMFRSYYRTMFNTTKEA